MFQNNVKNVSKPVSSQKENILLSPSISNTKTKMSKKMKKASQIKSKELPQNFKNIIKIITGEGLMKVESTTKYYFYLKPY